MPAFSFLAVADVQIIVDHQLLLDRSWNDFPIFFTGVDGFDPHATCINRYDRTATACDQDQTHRQQPLQLQHLHAPERPSPSLWLG